MALVEWQHAVTHVCAEYLPSDLIRSICSSQTGKKQKKMHLKLVVQADLHFLCTLRAALLWGTGA